MKLQIEKAVYGGDGLGRDAEGRAILLPYVLPGELTEVERIESREMPSRARLVQIERASPERVEARCRHFGRCGGCQYQHAAYALQLRIKENILSETLERAGLRDRPSIVMHAGEPWEYRNRIRLRVESVDGAIRFGYNLRDSREFLSIEECPIAAPVLWRAASAFEALCRADARSSAWLRSTAEIELFATGDQTQLQISMLLREERSEGFSDLCEKLLKRVPELVGAGAEVRDVKRRRRVVGARWGRDGLRCGVVGRSYWVSRGGFFQVNRFLVEELVRVVTAGRKGSVCWDLFAGVGLFSRVLAESFAEVVAVEANVTAIRDLAAAKEAKVRGVAEPVLEFLRRAAVGRQRPDLVVMDPPRAGVGAEACELLARVGVPQVVYVSCDPVTLARDLRGMVDSGYNLAELHLVDLFPQTFHLETVAVLERKPR